MLIPARTLGPYLFSEVVVNRMQNEVTFTNSEYPPVELENILWIVETSEKSVDGHKTDQRRFVSLNMIRCITCDTYNGAREPRR